MKTIIENEETLINTAGEFHIFHYESMSGPEAETRHYKEWFDKNNVSEDDIDRIWADI